MLVLFIQLTTGSIITEEIGMNLLDVIEKAVGSEYFDNAECSDSCLALQKASMNLEFSLNQSQQPNANKVVTIK